jgi:hypothetical protein
VGYEGLEPPRDIPDVQSGAFAARANTPKKVSPAGYDREDLQMLAYPVAGSNRGPTD